MAKISAMLIPLILALKCAEMDPAIFAQICQLIDNGDVCNEKHDFEHALENFESALKLIPKPISEWELTTHVWVAIGETFLFMKDYESARDVLSDLIRDPNANAIGIPYIHLRLGQAEYELGNFKRAEYELVRAYIGGGNKVFEDEDPKYLQVVMDANLRDFSL